MNRGPIDTIRLGPGADRQAELAREQDRADDELLFLLARKLAAGPWPLAEYQSPVPDPETSMSWSFTAIAKDKAKLKAHARKSLTSYHGAGSASLAMMEKVADAHDTLIDLWPQAEGRAIKLVSQGHVAPGQTTGCSCKIELDNSVPDLID